MLIPSDNNPMYVLDRHFAIKCPYCNTKSNLTAVSIPRYELLVRFQPKQVGIVYRCDSCNAPVFLRFEGKHLDGSGFHIGDEFDEVEKPKESFEYQYLPTTLGEDFKEALTCYSNSCYNAFAAMCRRSIQSAFAELGSDGTDKVQAQLRELKETTELDDDTYAMLQQIIVCGHDGAHPHLPKLGPDRAVVLLELMKDVLYELFIRKAKINESITLRKIAIEQGKQ